MKAAARALEVAGTPNSHLATELTRDPEAFLSQLERRPGFRLR